MNASAKLVLVELKLQFRDPTLVSFGLLFPAVLLVVLGFAFPGFQDPDPELGGARLIDVYTPILLVFVLVMVGVSAIATALATYRHDGVLRRLRTTPVGPSRLLAAHLLAQLVLAALGTALAVTTALLVLEVPAPTSWPGAAVSLALTAASMFAIGLLIGAVARSTSAANVISSLVWLPVMVLAGLWFPREAMPATMRRISDLSPGGAGVEALQQAWFGMGPPLSSLMVLVASSIVLGGLAALTFRWD